MKWHRPIQAYKELNKQYEMLATIAILALGLSLVAIFIVLGKE